MIYLTVNDAPSGVYKSQVIDVLKALNEHLDNDIQLIAFISFRNFKENRKKILSWYPKSKVIRMIPKLKFWQKNSILLSGIKGVKGEVIITRGPMAYQLATKVSGRIIYDGRGAVKAELTEFPNMIPDVNVVHSIIEAEKHAVLNAKCRIAVSNQLVQYWQNEFGYAENNHLVIPCTLSDSVEVKQESTAEILRELGWTDDVPILIYAGSTAGWQSFEKLRNILVDWIKKQQVKVLFLSKEDDQINLLQKEFPTQIQRKWLDHSQVSSYLAIGDYGILVRDQNVTNQVASPVKFAEYLMAGLKVIISPGLGDYSKLVEEHELGIVLQDNALVQLRKTTADEKSNQIQFATSHLTKQANRNQFIQLSKVMKELSTS